MSTPADALRCATALVDALVAAGIGGFVVAPGSRSTPLTLAVARSGAPAWVLLDERSAGFFALGRACVLDAPVAIVTTSGTAVANLLPAVVEASQRRVPLIVLSADRPPELHGVGANQTIPQEGLFGVFVREARSLATAAEEGAPAWEAAGHQAVATALGRPPGPVHLNLPFREPFIPLDAEPSRADVAAGTPPVRAVVPAAREDVARTLDLVAAAQRPLVYAGGLDDPARERVSLEGLAFVAEPTSGLRRPGFGSLVFAVEEVADLVRPDLVIQAGRSPTTRGASYATAAAATLVTVDPDGAVHDPHRHAVHTVRASGYVFLQELAGVDHPWAARWQAAVSAAEAEVAAAVEGPLWEGAVARLAGMHAPENSVLIAGSSLPIRDLDLYGPATIRATVVANRGASGIDGLVSTFAGAATTGRPTLALLGDLSTLHDASGLIWLAQESPGTLVVVDNGGGGIFDLLDSSRLPEHERWFVTPHRGRLERLLAATGRPLAQPETASELDAALTEALARDPQEPGMSIIHVRIPRERSSSMRATVRDRVAVAISAALR